MSLQRPKQIIEDTDILKQKTANDKAFIDGAATEKATKKQGKPGRKKKEDVMTVGFRIPKELNKKLEEESERFGGNKSALLVAILEGRTKLKYVRIKDEEQGA